jgi:tRNA threonylcarbamoyladenosine biosynthesis protein TsaB
MSPLLALRLPVLALDTATEQIAVGLHTGVSMHTTVASGGSAASTGLLPQLQGLLSLAGLSWADVKAIAFGQGPGAFTGLRTACSVAQGLAWGLGCRLYPIDSLLVVAEDARWQLNPSLQQIEVTVLMDARMDEIYAASYRWLQGTWQVVHAPALCSLALIQARCSQEAWSVLAGSALAAFGDRLVWPAATLRFAQEQDRAAALLRLAVAAVASGEGLLPAEALPLYLRDKVAHTTAERALIKARSVGVVLS